MTASALLLSLCFLPGQAKADPPAKPDFAPPVNAFHFRNIGPAVTSGRVAALAVNPKDRAHYFVAVASGGVWKTTNAGTTFAPVFDGEGSFSIGAVTMDPADSNTIWVGTGENNSQRSVAYGDGVYKSTDGGKSWKNMGLKASEHIAKIAVHPKDSDTVFVASQGPLWGAGGDRGLFKTTDGGKTWANLLKTDENTGVTDFVLDPRNPDIILAATYQRRRHVWTLVNGGPGSAMHRSTDGGKTWKKITAGLPGNELGRIALAYAPSDPDTIYAEVEAQEKAGGVFRSTDNGKTWEKRNPFNAQMQYFCKLVVDPKNKDRVLLNYVYNQVSTDGGKTFQNLGEANKHVDSHDIWIDPNDTKYHLCGCDGGLYDSHDSGATWQFKANLPVTQFYDIGVDQNPASGPFYHVYGGTQDNYTLGGPVRTRSNNGIVNADWYVVLGGDGFHCKVAPDDPDTVYAEYQYGGLVRFNRKTGNRVDIRPVAAKGEPPLRWNWDSALMISPHNPKRIYFAANKLYRSDDRGDNWVAVSGDLTQQLDRDKLKVFGKIVAPEAVAKHLSTSFYGNIVALAESLKTEGLLYAGTDDGLIQITEDGGKTWKKTSEFTGVPAGTYVAKLVAGQHDGATLFAAFDNHKNADFKPYLLKSTDAGKTWKSIAGNLPERGTVYCIAEDHVNPELLFCGTEFGLFATIDGGKKWHRMTNGLPTIQVKDLVIQKHNNDLVVGTFGRGIYVLDDYSPLRRLTAAAMEKPALLIAPESTMAYVQSSQLGGGGKSFQGSSHYFAENPPVGATFTFHLKEGHKSLKQKRLDATKEAEKAGKPATYPTLEELRAEAEEEPVLVDLVIQDFDGNSVNRIQAPTNAGVHRITWNLREAGVNPDAYQGGYGFLAAPGRYRAVLVQTSKGKKTSLSDPIEFVVKADPLSGLKGEEFAAISSFNKDVRTTQRKLFAANGTLTQATARLDAMRKAAKLAERADDTLDGDFKAVETALKELRRQLNGDAFLAERYENEAMSISERLGFAAGTHTDAVALPTGSAKSALADAKAELAEALMKVRAIYEKDLPALDKKLDAIAAPWSPGRWDFGKK